MKLNLAALALLAFSCSVAQAVSDFPQITPFWPKYADARAVTALDGTWEFARANGSMDATADLDPTRIQLSGSIQVPSAFDAAPPGVLPVRGTFFYRVKFPLRAGARGLLYFAACAFYCKVYIDGKPVLDHRAGGYQPFWVPVVANYNTSDRDLFVVVDNRFNATTAPLYTGGDFFMYSGITRHVLLHTITSDSYIHQVQVNTIDAANGIVDIRVEFVDAPDTVTVALGWDGDAPGNPLRVTVKDNVAVLTNMPVPNHKLWNIDSPNLHVLTVYLLSNTTTTTSSDSISVRFGLRELGVLQRTGQFMINGVVQKLHGVNRHTMWEDTGSALTLEQIHADLALLLDLGVNYVRGAHYPQDQRFLDLCDEHGIVVWEEALGPGVSLNNIQNDYFMAHQVQQLNEMMDASFNHPSVVFWGFFNEGPSSEREACVGYKTSADTIHQRAGSSRMVTWASDKTTIDKCLEHADLISFNSYPAWYINMPVDKIGPFWNEKAAWARSNYPQKAFTISETGAGGVYEWTNSTDVKWSQLYQAEVVMGSVTEALRNDNISGITIWQFSDIKANDGDTKSCGGCNYIPGTTICEYVNVSCGRPAGENHKGQVDFWRRTKLTYAKVRSAYEGFVNYTRK